MLFLKGRTGKGRQIGARCFFLFHASVNYIYSKCCCCSGVVVFLFLSWDGVTQSKEGSLVFGCFSSSSFVPGFSAHSVKPLHHFDGLSLGWMQLGQRANVLKTPFASKKNLFKGT